MYHKHGIMSYIEYFSIKSMSGRVSILKDYKYYNCPDFKSVDLKLYYCGIETCSPAHSWGNKTV